MRMKTMVAVALCLGGCDVAPDESEEATTEASSALSATIAAASAAKTAAPANAAGATLGTTTLGTTTVGTTTVGTTTVGITKLPAVTLAAVVGTGTVTSCTETALASALAAGGTVTFNCGGAATIAFTSSKTVANTVSVDGGSAVTLTGNFQTQLFNVTGTGTLNLAHIILEKGFNPTGDGGIIANHGYLNLNDVTVRAGIAGPGRSGGGLFTDGRNTKIDNSRFQGNSGDSGGAIFMTSGAVTAGIQIAKSQLTDNTAQGTNTGFGGAIWAAAGCLVVNDSLLSNNRAMQGGAIFASPNTVVTVFGSPTTAPLPSAMQFNSNSAVFDGGALFNLQGNVSITNSVFSTNRVPKDQLAVGFGGAIVNLGGYLGLSGGFFFKNEGRFGGAMFSGNSDAAVSNTVVDKTNFLQNSSGALGGAMYMHSADSTVTVTSSAFESNTSNTGGGLARNDTRLRIENSSFTRNTATSSGGALMISTLPGSSMNPYVRIQSVTVSGNTAVQGGGVFNTGAGLEMYSMTIVGNSSGVFTNGNGNSRFRSTVLQNAPGTNCSLATGSYSDDAGNFSTDLTCQLGGPSTQGTNLNPGLGPLTKDPNGLTSFLKAGARSPLLDRGASSCPTLDQIGAARIGLCDVGAVESGYNPLGAITGVLVGGGVLAQP